MSSSQGNQNNEPLYNNADSFGMAFDTAWKGFISKTTNEGINPDEKLDIVLETVKDHPFFKEFPLKAKEVARFRIRLLNLK